MPDIEFKIEGLKEAQDLLRQIGSRLHNPTPAMDAIGNLLVESIQRNFEAGGRPTPWAPLKESTKRQKTRNPDKILIESQTLQDSLRNYRLESGGRRLVLGTILPYARIHQFGFHDKVAVRAHEHRLPIYKRGEGEGKRSRGPGPG